MCPTSICWTYKKVSKYDSLFICTYHWSQHLEIKMLFYLEIQKLSLSACLGQTLDLSTGSMKLTSGYVSLTDPQFRELNKKMR